MLLSLGFLLSAAQESFAQFSSSCLTTSININTGYNHSAAALYPTSPSSASPVLDHYWQVTGIPFNTTGMTPPRCAQRFLTSMLPTWPNSTNAGWLGIVANAQSTNTAQLSPTSSFFWNCPPTTPYSPVASPTIFTRTFYVQSSNPSEIITFNIPNFWGDDYAQIFLDGSTVIYSNPSVSQTGGVIATPTPVSFSVAPGVHTVDVRLWDVSGQGTGIKMIGNISSLNNVLVSNACFGLSDASCAVIPPPPACNSNFTATLTLHTSSTTPFPIPDKSVQLDLDNYDPTSTYTVDYGDGSGTWPYNPSPFFHTYPGPGTYQVCITETTSSGTTCTSCYMFCIGQSKSASKVAPDASDASTGMTLSKQNTIAVIPNPTRGDAEVRLELSGKDIVKIAVIDMSGKRVAEVFNGMLNEGTQKVMINTDNLATGIYQVQINIGTQTIVQKLSVIK